MKVNFIKGDLKGNEYVFDSNNTQIVRIGRDKENEISISDNTISKNQCTFIFKENNWTFIDGEINSDKDKEDFKINENFDNMSLNGNW